MWVQDIFFATTKYRDNNFGDDDYFENLEILSNLERYVLSGSYTKRKNADYVLKNWKYESNVAISKKLNLTKQAVGIIKRDISKDLEKELGADFSNIVKDYKFNIIKSRLDKALKREELSLNNIVPNEVLDIASNLSNSGLDDLKSLYKISNKEVDDMILESLNAQIDYENMFFREIDLLKKLNTLSIQKELSSVNPYVFLRLVEILQGRNGGVKERNVIQEFITN